MFVRSQPRLQKLDLSINTETLCSEPDCSMTSDLRRKFMRKPDTEVRQDSSRQKRNHCEVKAFAGFFSPNNQQLTDLIRNKSNSDLKKLLFRNFPSAETPTSQQDDSSKRLENKVVSEQTLTGLNRSLYQFKTDRKKLVVDAKEEKENKPTFTSRKSIAEPSEKQLTEVDELRFEIEKLKDENAQLRSRLALTRKQLTEKTLKKEASSEQLQEQYKKANIKIKELNDELASLKLKNVRLEAEARTKQEVVSYMQRNINTLNEKIQELYIKQKALQSRLDTADKALKDVQQQLQKLNKERQNISCRLWIAQQKNSEIDDLKYQMKRHGNVVLINKQLRQLNNQLTRKLQRMNIVRDHELFSLSSEENLQ